MNIKKMTCPSCSATVDIDLEKPASFCVYCGSKLSIDFDADKVYAEREWTKRTAIKEDQETEREKIRQQEETKRVRAKKLKGPLGMYLDAAERVNDMNRDNADRLQRAIDQEEQRKRESVLWYASLSDEQKKVVDAQKREEEKKWQKLWIILGVTFVVCLIMLYLVK